MHKKTGISPAVYSHTLSRGKSRRLAKLLRRAERHRIERAKKNAKWQLCEKPLICAVLANAVFSSLLFLGSYCQQIAGQVDPATVVEVWDYCMRLVGV